MSTPGAILKEIRLKAGLSQEKFAELLYCCQSAVGRYEMNRHPIPKHIAKTLQKLYGIDPKLLIRE